VIEDDFGLRSALERDVDAHAVAVGLVAEVGLDVVDDFFVDEVAMRFIRVVLLTCRDFGDDDGFATAGLLDAGFARDHDRPRPVGRLADVAFAEDVPPVGSRGL